MNRSFRIEEDNKVTALCSYCPNYLLNKTFRFQMHSSCIEVFVFRGALAVLRPALVQAHYKQIPLLLSDTHQENLLQEYITRHGQLRIIDLNKVKLLLESLPSDIVNKKGESFDILQVDQKLES